MNIKELSTPSYVYSSSDCIGSGASSIVYKAYNKKTGITRAVKVLRDKSAYNIQDLHREVTSLRQLNHPNIIKLYGHEKELQSGREVLILGFCNSSLHSFLQEPENSQGLCDKEFLTLFRDLCSALSYLHNHNIIHRDLKPGNILRDYRPDLSPIYILSDFGTSRYLEENGAFFSLVGTEEFLHPALYEKAFVNRKLATPFTTGSELWSLACTLYQAITTMMPFTPFNGARKNRLTMYEMLVCKPKGGISANQKDEHGTIIWGKSFPPNCQLSRNLQDIMKNVLSCLMDADHQKQMSHRDLFRTQIDLDQKFQLQLFNSSNGTCVWLYFSPNNSFRELQEQIALYTDVPAEQQLVFNNDHLLNNVVMKGVRLASLLNKTQTNFLTLVIKDKHEEMKKYELESFPSYNDTNTVVIDYDVTFKRCQIVQCIVLLIIQSFQFQITTTSTISAMWILLKTYCLKVSKNFECLSITAIHFNDQLHMLVKGTQSLYRQTNICDENLIETLHQMKAELKPIAKTSLEMNDICDEYNKNYQKPRNHCTVECIQKLQRNSENLKKICNTMKSRKKLGVLSEMERIHHLRDRFEVEEMCAVSLYLFQDGCWKRKENQFQQFIFYKRLFIKCHEKAKDANRRMIKVKEYSDKIRYGLLQMYKDLDVFLCPWWSHINFNMKKLNLDEENPNEGEQNKQQSSKINSSKRNGFNKRSNSADDIYRPCKEMRCCEQKKTLCCGQCNQDNRLYTERDIA